MKSKSVWDSCSTSHISLSGRVISAVNTIAENKGIDSVSKVVQVLLLESSTLNEMLDELEASGWHDKRLPNKKF